MISRATLMGSASSLSVASARPKLPDKWWMSDVEFYDSIVLTDMFGTD